jgi:hypothetical protein
MPLKLVESKSILACGQIEESKSGVKDQTISMLTFVECDKEPVLILSLC